MKNITWQQILAFVALLVVPALVHKYVGSDEGQVANAASILLAWLMNPPGGDSGGKGASTTAATMAFCLMLSACGMFQLDAAGRKELEDYQRKLSHCQDVGRDAGSFAAYDNCTKEGGL